MATKKDKNQKLLDVLYKKSIGYQTEEVVEEYAGDEKGGELLKRKVTKKSVPPDISALKVYMDAVKFQSDFEELDDESLNKEKIRLINLLKTMEDKNENK